MGKFKDFVSRPAIKKEIDMDDRFLLSESEHVEVVDIAHFKHILQNPTHGKYVLRSYSDHYTEEEREVEILALMGRKVVKLTYNADFLEFTQEMVDLCDDLGYKVEEEIERPINTQTLTIYR